MAKYPRPGRFSDLLIDVNAVKLDFEGAELEILDRRHDRHRVEKVVMEYHFDFDRLLANLYRRMETLAKTFNNIHYRKMPAGPTWDHFPAAVIASFSR